MRSNLQKMTGDQSRCIAFSVGIDAMILVKTFGVHHTSHAIVGGVRPNVMLDISGLSSDQVKEMLKECVDEKRHYGC